MGNVQLWLKTKKGGILEKYKNLDKNSAEFLSPKRYEIVRILMNLVDLEKNREKYTYSRH